MWTDEGISIRNFIQGRKITCNNRQSRQLWRFSLVWAHFKSIRCLSINANFCKLLFFSIYRKSPYYLLLKRKRNKEIWKKVKRKDILETSVTGPKKIKVAMSHWKLENELLKTVKATTQILFYPLVIIHWVYLRLISFLFSVTDMHSFVKRV